jgi:polyisoprenoid-binding protein YceI
MKKISTIAALLLAISMNATAADTNTWKVDRSHSKVEFSVTHMMVSETSGNFKMFDGTVTSDKDDFTDAKIEFTVDVATINTDDEARDKHLRSDDFFSADKYPKMTFKSTSFKKVSGNKYKLVGDLTIRDVTKKVEFDVTYNGTVKDPWGNTRAGFKLNGNINRVDYGLKWNAMMETGGMVVSENVNILCNVEFIKDKK